MRTKISGSSVYVRIDMQHKLRYIKTTSIRYLIHSLVRDAIYKQVVVNKKMQSQFIKNNANKFVVFRHSR